jgi:hypothetical protein
METNMTRISSLLPGFLLMLVGGLMLAYTVFGSIFGVRLPQLWQLWPVWVAGVGLFFILPPVIWPQHHGLGGLFIPGMPIMAVSVVGMLSIFRGGQVWGTFWPFIIMGVAFGFALAALYMRVIWLLIPSFIIGAIGVALQFSALTGLWGAWAVLWVSAPLGLGLALLVISLTQRSGGLFIAGAVVAGSAVGMAMLMVTVLMQQWGIGSALLGLGLVAIGVLLIGRSLLFGRFQAAQ